MRARSTLQLLAGVLAACFAAASPAPADPGYTAQMLYLSVYTGPDNATQCTIESELFYPNYASATNRVPALLSTNGFGGSYLDQVAAAKTFTQYGYATLAYSGLGFGGSECKISLDAPEYDGKAASQLVSFLGGKGGIAFTDPGLTQPYPALDFIKLDSVDHHGVPAEFDPRVGMFGGSYGGGAQFSAASVDPRIDTIIPMITWNDLSYSLTPNGTSTYSGVSSTMSGAAKMLFAAALFADGVDNPGVAGYVGDPARIPGCPNYIPYMCGAVLDAGITGQLNPDYVALLRASSVGTYIDKIDIPVLLAQGEQDTLFILNEAVATYEALQARGVEVKMIWQSWGHSHLEPAPGEFSSKNGPPLDPAAQYETGRMLDWFDHYLKDSGVDTGPEFAYFRNWVPYTGNAAPAYAESAVYPVGTEQTFALSGAERLVTTDPLPGSRTLYTAPAGLPTGIEPLNITPNDRLPSAQIPGTDASWTTEPMSAPLDVAGIPTIRLRVQAPGEPVVFVKVYDVAPDGTESLIDGLITPVRIPVGATDVPVTLAGFVHRFDVGHSIRLTIAGGDISFRGGAGPLPVTIFADGSGPLTLPVVN